MNWISGGLAGSVPSEAKLNGATGMGATIQYFGRALDLNPHEHFVVVDGVFSMNLDGTAAVSTPMHVPAPSEVREFSERVRTDDVIVTNTQGVWLPVSVVFIAAIESLDFHGIHALQSTPRARFRQPGARAQDVVADCNFENYPDWIMRALHRTTSGGHAWVGIDDVKLTVTHGARSACCIRSRRGDCGLTTRIGSRSAPNHGWGLRMRLSGLR